MGACQIRGWPDSGNPVQHGKALRNLITPELTLLQQPVQPWSIQPLSWHQKRNARGIGTEKFSGDRVFRLFQRTKAMGCPPCGGQGDLRLRYQR